MAYEEFLMTTSTSLEGYRIIKQCGVVFGEAVFKHGYWKTIGASFSDAVDKIKWGSREMSGSTALIQEARDYAYQKMISDAKAKGANAIIAIDSDNTIGGEIMYVSLYGTAVKVVTEENYEKEKKKEQEREQQEKERIQKMKEDIAQRKMAIEEDIEQRKQRGDAIDTTEVSSEELFLEQMKDEQTVVGIWKVWSVYDLGSKYRNIDTYLAMRKDSELQQGKLNNIEKIKEVTEQMLLKEMQESE